MLVAYYTPTAQTRCYNLSLYWLAGRGSGAVFDPCPRLHSTVQLYTLGPVLPCILLDNQLVFSASQSYVRRVNICSEHLSNVDGTWVWRHFSRSDGMGTEGRGGGGVGVCLQCSVVKGLFLPVQSNILHDFMITGG